MKKQSNPTPEEVGAIMPEPAPAPPKKIDLSNFTGELPGVWPFSFVLKKGEIQYLNVSSGPPL